MLEAKLQNWVGGLQSHYQKYIEELLKAEGGTVLSVSKNPDFEFPGVYVIYSDEDILWVGKTTSRSVQNRMRQHMQQNTNSDLNHLIGKDACAKCKVRAVNIADDRERMLVECFLTSVLNPRYNKPPRK